MVVVIASSAGPTTLQKLGSARSSKRNIANWRDRNSEEEFVHIAESSAHQEWLKKMLEIRGSSTDFEAGKHEVWLERQRDRDQSEAHTAWVHGQKSSAEEVKNTPSCHEDWLKDMQMPLSQMDGGEYQDQLTIAAAAYVQSLWRGRAARVGTTASIVKELSRRSSGDQSLTNLRIETERAAETSPGPHASEPAHGTIDAPTVPQPRSPLALEAVAVVQEAPPGRRSRVGVPSGCLGRASKRDKAQRSPASPSSPAGSNANISSTEV
eukprot:scaffold48681_cov57-Phaeocystis_antarctica.AAC.3